MDSQPLIDLTEDEEKALNDLIDKIDLPDIGKAYRFKSLLWTDLRLQRPNHKDDDFSTKSIYLLVNKYDNRDCCSWYSIPLGKKPDPSRSSILSPIKEMGTSHPTSAVAFPPKRIVTLRGRSAKCFDFEYPEGGWKELPNLSAWRDIPSAIAADGKIYVAGFPRIFSGTKPFVDVYDPIWNERSWYKIENVELPDLDSPIPGGTFISDATRGRHILFHGPAFGNAAAASVLYTFHLDTGEINYAECPFPRLVEGAAVVVDGYICAFVRTNADMRAYDLTTKKWIPNPVSGLDDIDWNCANLRLLPIGRKKMCIIIDDSIICDGQEADKGYLNEGQMSVRCRLTIFDVEKKDDDHGLKANIISSTIFIVPGGSIIHGCIVI